MTDSEANEVFQYYVRMQVNQAMAQSLKRKEMPNAIQLGADGGRRSTTGLAQNSDLKQAGVNGGGRPQNNMQRLSNLSKGNAQSQAQL